MVTFEGELSYLDGYKDGLTNGKEIGHENGYVEGFRDGLNDLVDKELGNETKIYRVFGITGEYEDVEEWTVKCFRTRILADKYVKQLCDYLLNNNFFLRDEYLETNLNYREQSGFKHPLDERFLHKKDTRYGIEEMVLC